RCDPPVPLPLREGLGEGSWRHSAVFLARTRNRRVRRNPSRPPPAGRGGAETPGLSYHQPMPAVPTHLKLDKARQLDIDWADDTHSVYPIAYLRRNCPCAACKTDRA